VRGGGGVVIDNISSGRVCVCVCVCVREYKRGWGAGTVGGVQGRGLVGKQSNIPKSIYVIILPLVIRSVMW
jgi:hypothetical protein